ncbi:MAG: hypothetical protein UR60_C0028G0012 [Candidatus Moranbacteria bacterium GW2011_GWF2_34_56]|nr:MAG: hypothetical protein UR60_C0028G0012 [Candidatus Moranbacteria bacterium GW2011_GWF2_34_56]
MNNIKTYKEVVPGIESFLLKNNEAEFEVIDSDQELKEEDVILGVEGSAENSESEDLTIPSGLQDPIYRSYN